MKHVPIKRLSSAPAGSTIALSGIQHHPSLYVGLWKDGYAFLWKTAEEMQAGIRWIVMASGSHEIEVLQ